MMEVILQLPLFMYELQRLVTSVDDRLLSHNVMFPLTIGLYNGINLLVIGGIYGQCMRVSHYSMPSNDRVE
jgi:hypothetical protein